MTRPYDIVVFGATGFTGGKTAEYLARNAPGELRWAIAGRSRDKLEARLQALRGISSHEREIGVIEARVDDEQSLRRMAAQARVVLTTVGPFIDYGEPLVRACIAEGSDYVDSTGEPHFVDLLRARHAEQASARGVRIVSSCGFDSIPADLGALFTVEQLPPDKPIDLAGYMQLQASFSGGTERSAIKSLAPPPERLALPPLTAGEGRQVRLRRATVHRSEEAGGWAAPLPTLDGSIVERSAASLERYGPDFSYAHHVVHRTLLGMLAAGLFFGGLALAARIAPLRKLMLRGAKPSGRGPTDEQMGRAWFRLRFVARCDGRTVRTEVSGGDPGYGETSKMLAESAMCLACDSARLPQRVGILTPAEAMGDCLLERLRNAGLRFAVLS